MSIEFKEKVKLEEEYKKYKVAVENDKMQIN